MVRFWCCRVQSMLKLTTCDADVMTGSLRCCLIASKWPEGQSCQGGTLKIAGS